MLGDSDKEFCPSLMICAFFYSFYHVRWRGWESPEKLAWSFIWGKSCFEQVTKLEFPIVNCKWILGLRNWWTSRRCLKTISINHFFFLLCLLYLKLTTFGTQAEMMVYNGVSNKWKPNCYSNCRVYICLWRNKITLSVVIAWFCLFEALSCYLVMY